MVVALTNVTNEQLKTLIGEHVGVEFFDGMKIEGELGFTEEFSTKYGYRKPGYFTIGDTNFKVSHIKCLWIPNQLVHSQGPVKTPEEWQKEKEATDCIGREYTR